MALRRFSFAAASGLSVGYIIQTRVCGITTTTGSSMLPTVDEGGILLVRKGKMNVQTNLKRGDVVLCLSVENPGELIVKRVTAMEGDRMPDILQPINRYIRHSDSKTVPLGHIWLRGDNYDDSTDSRHYGPVPLALVQGRVLCQMYPQYRKIESAL